MIALHAVIGCECESTSAFRVEARSPRASAKTARDGRVRDRACNWRLLLLQLAPLVALIMGNELTFCWAGCNTGSVLAQLGDRARWSRRGSPCAAWATAPTLHRPTRASSHGSNAQLGSLRSSCLLGQCRLGQRLSAGPVPSASLRLLAAASCCSLRLLLLLLLLGQCPLGQRLSTGPVPSRPVPSGRQSARLSSGGKLPTYGRQSARLSSTTPCLALVSLAR
jgi:hypothetical protein